MLANEIRVHTAALQQVKLMQEQIQSPSLKKTNSKIKSKSPSPILKNNKKKPRKSGDLAGFQLNVQALHDNDFK